MKIEEIKNQELKDLINMSYLHGENQNQQAIEEDKGKISEYIKEHELIISMENGEAVKIPYGNDGEYVVPVFTDNQQYCLGMQYFSLNLMDDEKDYIIEKVDYFKKLKEDPNFLGFLVNIARISYIITVDLI